MTVLLENTDNNSHVVNPSQPGRHTQVAVRPPPAHPQFQQQINPPDASSLFGMTPLPASLPGQFPPPHNVQVDSCSNCSKCRQLVSPSINMASPNPPISNYSAPQPFPGAGNVLPPQIQPRTGNMQLNYPPMPGPVAGTSGRTQHFGPMWSEVSAGPPPVQRSASNGPGLLNPMISNVDLFDLNQGPLHQVGSNYVNNVVQPMPVQNPFVMGRPGVFNGSYAPQPVGPIPPFNPAGANIRAPIPPHRPALPAGPPFPQPGPKPREETDLATQLGFLSINFENDSGSTAAKLTSKYVMEMYDVLTRLAVEITPLTKPTDTTPTILAQLVQRFNLPHPSEWRISLRTHSCIYPLP